MISDFIVHSINRGDIKGCKLQLSQTSEHPPTRAPVNTPGLIDDNTTKGTCEMFLQLFNYLLMFNKRMNIE